jgi:hypothetical protein
MDTRRPLVVRHAVILAVWIVVLTGIIPMCFYSFLVGATGDMGGPLVLPSISCANLVTSIVAAIVYAPLTILLERLLHKTRPRWQQWALSPLVAGVSFAIILVLVLLGWVPLYKIFASGSTETPKEWIYYIGPIQVSGLYYLCGGVPLVLGGPLYWFLLRISDKLVGPALDTGVNGGSGSP